MSNKIKQKKQFPLYLVAIIAIVSFFLVAFIASLIAGATVEGELNGLEKLLLVLGTKMTKPAIFGAWHIVSLVLTIAFAVFLVVKFKDCSDATLRRILLAVWLVMLLFEVYKQVHSAFHTEYYEAWNFTYWEYSLWSFPFQFCSTPIYVALAAMCLREGKLRRAFLAFLATYSPVAGCAVLFYPASDVFHEILFLDVHTMLWHGGMLIFGLYLWLTEAVTPSVKTALTAAAVYLPMPVIALILNEVELATGFAGNYTFNMFYVARDGFCMIPVLSWFQAHTPYPVFFAAYVLTLGVGGALVTAGMWGIRNVKCKMQNAECRMGERR